jgi:hypothetical protein
MCKSCRHKFYVLIIHAKVYIITSDYYVQHILSPCNMILQSESHECHITDLLFTQKDSLQNIYANTYVWQHSNISMQSSMRVLQLLTSCVSCVQVSDSATCMTFCSLCTFKCTLEGRDLLKRVSGKAAAYTTNWQRNKNYGITFSFWQPNDETEGGYYRAWSNLQSSFSLLSLPCAHTSLPYLTYMPTFKTFPHFDMALLSTVRASLMN